MKRRTCLLLADGLIGSISSAGSCFWKLTCWKPLFFQKGLQKTEATRGILHLASLSWCSAGWGARWGSGKGGARLGKERHSFLNVCRQGQLTQRSIPTTLHQEYLKRVRQKTYGREHSPRCLRIESIYLKPSAPCFEIQALCSMPGLKWSPLFSHGRLRNIVCQPELKCKPGSPTSGVTM